MRCSCESFLGPAPRGLADDGAGFCYVTLSPGLSPARVWEQSPPAASLWNTSLCPLASQLLQPLVVNKQFLISDSYRHQVSADLAGFWMMLCCLTNQHNKTNEKLEAWSPQLTGGPLLFITSSLCYSCEYALFTEGLLGLIQPCQPAQSPGPPISRTH